jgi:hypothetical protein
MSKLDNFGRPWARVSDTKPGDILECDAGFSCLVPSSLRVVKLYNETGLYIQCLEGMHFLDGQEQDGYYIGLYHKESKEGDTHHARLT